MDDPLTPQLEMSAVHKFRFWWLFNQGGKPVVLYRRKHTKKHPTTGLVTNELSVEWGNLESNFFEGDTRQQFIDAWNQLLDWSGANK